MFNNMWPRNPLPFAQVGPRPGEDPESLGAYMRRGGQAGIAAAIGMEGVVIVFFMVTRFGLIVLGAEDGVDELFGCLTIVIATIFAAIGWFVGVICGAIAHANRR